MSRPSPLVLVALAMLAGIGLLHSQAVLPSWHERVLACLGAALLLWMVALRHRTHRRLSWAQAVCMGVACALCAWSWAGWRAQVALESRLPEALEGIDLKVSGRVRGLPQQGSYGVRFEFEVEQCEPACLALRWVSLHWARPGAFRRSSDTDSSGSSESRPPAQASPQPGERWLLTVRLKRPHAGVNPGAFDRELRWLQEGVDGVGTVRHGQRALSPGIGHPLIWIERWREQVRHAMTHAMASWSDRTWRAERAGAEGTLLALAVGDQAAIDSADWSVFNRTGIGHLMSISGLHITVLAAMAGGLAARLWRSRLGCRIGLPLHRPMQHVRWIVAMAVGLFYSLLAGWGIPAQRTAFMLTIAAVLLMSGRAQSMTAVLSSAMIAVLLLDPWALLTPGFWLSFGAVSILVWAGQGASLGPTSPWARLRVAIHTQWAATLAMLPLGILFFGSVSWVGPVANALAIPLVSAVLTPAALAGGALSAVHPTLGGLVLGPALWVTDGLLAAVQGLSEFRWAVTVLPVPGPGLTVLAGLGVVLILAPRGLARRVAGGFALLPLLLVPADRPESAHWRLTALDVGQGSALVLQAHDYTLLYDTGPAQPGTTDAGERIVVPWLQRSGLRRLDELVVSHLDLDHSGGLHSVLKHIDTEMVRASFAPVQAGLGEVQASRTDIAVPLWQACARHDSWSHGNARFTILHPRTPPEPARGSPSYSLSFVIRADGPVWRSSVHYTHHRAH